MASIAGDTQTLVLINKAMENAVEEMENTTWEHLRLGLGVGNPFISQIIRVRGSLSGTYEKSRIVLPLYFKNIDRAMSISLLRKNVRSNFYETDYIAFLEDVRLLATNAEKYNGIADVVTNAAWELYKIAEKYDPDKTETRTLSKTAASKPVCPTGHRNSTGASSSGTLSQQHRKGSKRATKLANNNEKASLNLKKSPLSRKAASKLIEELAIHALRIARNITVKNTGYENQPNTSDERFIENVLKRTTNFSIDEAYATLLKTWQNAILSYTSIDGGRLDNKFVGKQIKSFLRLAGLPVSGKKRDCCKRLSDYITKLQNESWQRNEVCAKSVLGLFKKFEGIEASGHSFLLGKCRVQDPISTYRCLVLSKASVIDCNMTCSFCDSKSIRLGHVARCFNCKRFWHTTCLHGTPISLHNQNEYPYSVFVHDNEENVSESPLKGCCQQSRCFVCRSRDLSPIFLARGMMCKPQIISVGDTSFATTLQFDRKTLPVSSRNSCSSSTAEDIKKYVDRSTFDTVLKKGGDGTRYQVWVRLFPVLQGNEYGNLIDDQKNGENRHRCSQESFLISINDSTIYARAPSAITNVSSRSQFMKTITLNNGDIDITSDINLSGKNVIKVALSTRAQDLSFAKYICSVELIEKITLEKIKESVNKLTFIEGEAWVKTYFAKKSKGIEIPFVNMSLKCPLSTARLVCPIRTVTCKHLQCFDLETFWNYSIMMSLANKTAKCPICKAPARVRDVQICGYTQQVLTVATKEDTENATIFPDGTYRIDIESKDKNLNNPKKRKRSKEVDNEYVAKDGSSSKNTENNTISNTVILLSSDDEEDSKKDSDNENLHGETDCSMRNSANEYPLDNDSLDSLVNSTPVGINRTGSSYDDAIVLD